MLPGFAMIMFGIGSLVDETSYRRKNDSAVSIGYTHIFYFEPFLSISSMFYAVPQIYFNSERYRSYSTCSRSNGNRVGDDNRLRSK